MREISRILNIWKWNRQTDYHNILQRKEMCWLFDKRQRRAIASNEVEKIKLRSSLPAGMLIDKIPLREYGLSKSCICQIQQFEFRFVFLFGGIRSKQEFYLPDATMCLLHLVQLSWIATLIHPNGVFFQDKHLNEKEAVPQKCSYFCVI